MIQNYFPILLFLCVILFFSLHEIAFFNKLNVILIIILLKRVLNSCYYKFQKTFYKDILRAEILIIQYKQTSNYIIFT